MRIGQLAAITGVTSKTLRFYEAEGLLPPTQRTVSGYRDYTNESTHRIDFIRRGQAAGLTLAQIRQILTMRDDGRAPCEHVIQLLDQRLLEIDRQIADLRALRSSIADLRSAADDVDPNSCQAEDVCLYL
ncbi:heavy metal-responsive transcriptional regulator [Propionibacteriaceae bacterium G1746]